MVYVVVTMKIAKGKMNEVLAACEWVRERVLKEKGCQGYEHTRDIPSPLGIQEPIDTDRITLVEKWETIEDLVAHGKAPHMAPFAERVKGLRESVTARVTEAVFE
jgi:quinol monooxygenase YgiN